MGGGAQAVGRPYTGGFDQVPAHAATPEAQVAPTISAQLEQQDRNQEMTDWVSKITKSYCKGGKIKYQAGYQPSPDPCTLLATATSTTDTSTSG